MVVASCTLKGLLGLLTIIAFQYRVSALLAYEARSAFLLVVVVVCCLLPRFFLFFFGLAAVLHSGGNPCR